MSDLNFQNCLDELAEIHKLMPDLKFGEVLQNALDKYKGRANCDLCQHSTKYILEALRWYKEKNASQRKIAYVETRGFAQKIEKKEVTKNGNTK